MALPTVCVDDNDFQVDPNGRLQLNPHTAQNANETFSFQVPPVTPDGTYVAVTPFDAVPVPEDGTYLVTWDMHGYVALPSPNPGVPLNGGIMGALAVNGVFRAGTETMLATINEGSATNDVPALGQEGSGSGSRVFSLAAGDLLSLMAAQEGNGSNDSRIISDDRGRCRITAIRLGP